MNEYVMNIKGANVFEWSYFASILSVDLSAMGGLPESFLTARCTRYATSLVALVPGNFAAPEPYRAIDSFVGNLEKLGFPRAFIGVGGPFPDFDSRIVEFGFKPGILQWRWTVPLKPEDAQKADPAEFELKPFDLSVTDQAEYFRDSYGGSSLEAHQEHTLSLFQHESRTPMFGGSHYSLYRRNERLGSLIFADFNNREGKKWKTIVTPILKKECWVEPLRSTIFRWTIARAARLGMTELTMTCEDSQKDRFELYESLGMTHDKGFRNFIRVPG
jgi:hypothetical protein